VVDHEEAVRPTTLTCLRELFLEQTSVVADASPAGPASVPFSTEALELSVFPSYELVVAVPGTAPGSGADAFYVFQVRLGAIEHLVTPVTGEAHSGRPVMGHVSLREGSPFPYHRFFSSGPILPDPKYSRR
jgi:hypothetical protein